MQVVQGETVEAGGPGGAYALRGYEGGFWGLARRWCVQEVLRQRPQMFLWVPVLFALGISAYFSLAFEPVLWVSFAGLCIFSLFFAFLNKFFKSNASRLFLIFFLIFISGFLIAQFRTHFVYTAMLERAVGPIMVEGRVKALERLDGGGDRRVLLGDVSVEDGRKMPRFVRLRYRGEENLQAGQWIRARARLMPLSSPVMPGGFDFQRFFYFKGIGAVGFIYKDVEVIRQENAGTLPGFLSGVIQNLRQDISARVYKALPEREAAIITALMIGERSDIDEEDQQAMRASGLAHMLAISGLHVGLVCGVLFFFCRLCMAAHSGLALRYPIKKYAALLALVGGVFYMVMAGATVPTQRAMFMSGVVLLAIMLDRDPFSLRLVAFAALVVLLISPESLLSPSFQMSFSAVGALVWFFEETKHFWVSANRKAGFFRRVALYFAGVSATTIIAGLATAPFALYHFQQFSNYSVFANFFAMPVLAFLVMPMAVVSALSMPFGLEALPLRVMGYGGALILEIAHGVSGLPGADVRTRLMPFAGFACIVMFLICFFLVKGPVRYGAFLLLLCGGVLWKAAPLPDVLVSANHKLMGFRDEEGALRLSSLTREKFVADNWWLALGMGEQDVRSWKERDDMMCDDVGCYIVLRGYQLAFSAHPASHKTDCAHADLLVAEDPVEISCDARVIDKFDTWGEGAHAVYLEGGGLRVVHTARERGVRPWVILR